MTAGTLEYALRERHLLAVSTSTACLTRIGRIHSNVASPSLFRFGVHLTEECRPRDVMNALGQTVIMGQAVHQQVFDTDDPIRVDNLTALLVSEVLPSPTGPFMNSRYCLPVFAAFRRALCELGVLALYLCQGFFFFAKEAWVGDLFTCREGCKGLETYVYPHLGRDSWQAFGFYFTGERSIPLAGRGMLNCTSLDLALDGTMIDHLDATYLGEAHTFLMGDTEARLRERERVIAAPAFEARIARSFSTFSHAAEKGFHGKVNTDGYILQHLGVDFQKRRAYLLQHRERIDLPIAGERLPILLPGITALLKQMVIKPATFLMLL